MVIPDFANSFITSKTSLIISGSNADVGSSKSIIFGSIARALAIATLCCCPPDSCPGNLFACSGIPTRSKSSIAFCSESDLLFFLTHVGARVMFCKTVRCGNRLKL